MVLIAGHCSSFDIKILYVPQKLNEMNNFDSAKINISDEHFKVFFKNYCKSKKNIWLFFIENQISACFHTNSMNAAKLFCKRKYKISINLFYFFPFVLKSFKSQILFTIYL